MELVKQKKLVNKILTLKKISKKDVYALYKIKSDKTMSKQAGLKADKNILETYNFLKNINFSVSNNIFYFWGIYHYDTLVGVIALWNFENDIGEVSYFIGKKFQRKGYMQQALKLVLDFGFKQVKLKAIVAYVAVSNQASIGLVRKLNFKYIKSTYEMEANNNLVYMDLYQIDNYY